MKQSHRLVALLIAVALWWSGGEVWAETARSSSSELPEESEVEGTGLPPVYFWVGVSGTLVSAALATGLGSWALSMRTDVRETDARVRTVEQLDRIDRVALLTDVFWGISGALAIAAIVLGVLTDWSDDGMDSASSPRWWIRPTMSGLVLGGEL